MSEKRIELSALSGKRIALVVTLPAGVRVFTGVGVYVHQEGMGNLLRVELDECAESDGSPEFVFDEKSWKGEIVRDVRHGCQYAIGVDATAKCQAIG